MNNNPIGQSGNNFYLLDITKTYDKLPIGVYSLCFNDKTGDFYLKEKPNFVLPSKVYGDHSIIHRWLKSYEVNSHKNMGIILSGLKGSGKTITAQKFCIESKKPVIIIGDAFVGADFVNFLTNPVFSESIIFIDEFEKIYNLNTSRDDNPSKDLLTLMDGTFQTKLIFLLTVNTFNLNDYFVNRLNRIKYRKDYTDLDQSVVDEVIEDLLVNKEHKESIIKFFETINICTFDLLVNVINEMNLFNEDAITIGKYLNLKAEDKTYDVFELFEGKEYPCYGITLTGNTKNIEIERRNQEYLSEDEKIWSIEVNLEHPDCTIEKISNKSFILKQGKFTFKFTEQSKFSLIF